MLVNAAGIVSLDHPLEAVDETWERVFAVNLTAIVAICRSVVPKMIQGGGGAVVNIASVAAFNSSPATTSYAASKAALVSYTRSLAFAHGPDGIRADVVAPGWVRTPMSEMEMRMRRLHRHHEGRGIRGPGAGTYPATGRAAGGDRCLLRIPRIGRCVLRQRQRAGRRWRRTVAYQQQGGVKAALSPHWESEMTGKANTADIVLRNGRIYTVDTRRSWAAAVAVRNGRIVAVGSDADVKALIGKTTTVVDLGGRMAMPGIVDAHNHILLGRPVGTL